MDQNVVMSISKSKSSNLRKLNSNSNASISKYSSNEIEKDQISNEAIDKYSFNNENSQINHSIAEMIKNVMSKNSKLRSSYVNILQQENSINTVIEKKPLVITKNLSRPIQNTNLKATNFHSKRLASLHVNTQVNNTENTTCNTVVPEDLSHTNSINQNITIKNFYIPYNENNEQNYFTEDKKESKELNSSPKTIKVDYSAKISDIISHFKKAITDVQLNNKSLMSKFTSNNPKIKCLSELNKTCFYSITEKDNLIKDTYYESKVFHQYRSYLKRKQEVFHNGNKQMFSTFKDEQQGTLSDDIVCVICNDGDYEEDNLIVYCAVSNIYIIKIY